MFNISNLTAVDCYWKPSKVCNVHILADTLEVLNLKLTRDLCKTNISTYRIFSSELTTLFPLIAFANKLTTLQIFHPIIFPHSKLIRLLVTSYSFLLTKSLILGQNNLEASAWNFECGKICRVDKPAVLEKKDGFSLGHSLFLLLPSCSTRANINPSIRKYLRIIKSFISKMKMQFTNATLQYLEATRHDYFTKT